MESEQGHAVKLSTGFSPFSENIMTASTFRLSCSISKMFKNLSDFRKLHFSRPVPEPCNQLIPLRHVQPSLLSNMILLTTYSVNIIYCFRMDKKNAGQSLPGMDGILWFVSYQFFMLENTFLLSCFSY